MNVKELFRCPKKNKRELDQVKTEAIKFLEKDVLKI
jgi:hypothetical protein